MQGKQAILLQGSHMRKLGSVPRSVIISEPDYRQDRWLPCACSSTNATQTYGYYSTSKKYFYFIQMPALNSTESAFRSIFLLLAVFIKLSPLNLCQKNGFMKCGSQVSLGFTFLRVKVELTRQKNWTATLLWCVSHKLVGQWASRLTLPTVLDQLKSQEGLFLYVCRRWRPQELPLLASLSLPLQVYSIP